MTATTGTTIRSLIAAHERGEITDDQLADGTLAIAEAKLAGGIVLLAHVRNENDRLDAAEGKPARHRDPFPWET